MPNKKKKYSARFPPARIKKIMQKDDEVGKVAAAVPVIISRSLELFVESLIKKTNNLVLSRNARTLTPQHIKQTVLVENEFRFLHEVVSTIPDVQSTEDDQPPPSHQPPPHEAPRPILPDPIVMATSSTVSASASSTSVVKPGGKQRGRPKKIKTDDVKPSKPKKARLASNAEDCDSEETCSGSEDENKEFNDQPKQKSSAPQKSVSSKAVPQYLPACMSATLPILFNAPIMAGPNNHILNNAFPISVELPNSSKVADAYTTPNGTNAGSSSATQQQQQLVTSPQNLATAPSNEEVLDLSTSSGKNGDLKKDMEGLDVGHQNALLGKALPIPRTFYMTNILNANVQTVSHPNIMEGNKPLQNTEAYKLNIPKISIPPAGAALIKTDLMSPLACRPSQPQQNFTNATSPMGSPPPQITYQIQNLAQKGHQPQIIFSQMRPEMNQNAATDSQFFGAGSPVRLLQYPRFVSMVPGNLFGGLKLPISTSAGIVTQAVATTTEDSKTRPDNCATKDGQS